MEPEGNVADIDLTGFLVRFGRTSFTGAVRFENDGLIKIVYFKDGYILSASTNDRTDSLDEILVRTGKATRDHIRQALARRKEDESLGEALLGLGFVTKRDIASARRLQVANLIRSLQGWTRGSYAVVPDYLPRRSEGTIFATDQIVLEVQLTSQDRETADSRLEGGQKVLRKSSEFDERYPTLDLNDDADEIASHIDGRRAASEIAAASSSDSFSVYKLLIGLESIGLLEVVTGHPDVRESRSAEMEVGDTPPTLDGREFNQALDKMPLELADDLWGGSAEPAATSTSKAGAVDLGPVSDEFETPADSRADYVEDTDELKALLDLPKTGGEEKAQGEEQLEGVDGGETSVFWEDPPINRETMWRREGPRWGVWISTLMVVVLLGVAGGYLLWLRRGGVGNEQTTEGPRGATIKLPEIDPPVPEPAVVAVEETESTTVPQREPAPRTTKPAGERGASNPKRAEYLRMAEEFGRRKDPQRYTIQFELVCQDESVDLALRLGGEKVWFVPVEYGGRSCFRVFWGDYGDDGSAGAAVGEIPGRLRGGKPMIVQIREVMR